jgi:hypothetical protein
MIKAQYGWVVAVLSMFCIAAHGQSANASAASTPPKASAEQKHRADDIAQHRVMAQAHSDAAKCLESGKPEKQCQEALRAACQGIALGRFCGMKHAH